MPYMQTSLQRINGAFSSANIATVPRETISNAADLADAFSSLPGVDLSDGAVEFIRSWPSALQAAVLAAIVDNLSRDDDRRVPIVMTWTPGYDFDVRIWDVRNTESSDGELTIHLTSRYPGDPHPLGAPSYLADS